MSWEAFTQALGNAKDTARNWVRDLKAIPDRASDIADEAFPNSARDLSMKNAYRHALGTGMMTHHLGGGILGGALAKMAGWGWEAPTLIDPRSTTAEVIDSKHDLNANAIGASVAQWARNQKDLEAVLKGYAERSFVTSPPGVLSESPGWMTRAVR